MCEVGGNGAGVQVESLARDGCVPNDKNGDAERPDVGKVARQELANTTIRCVRRLALRRRMRFDMGRDTPRFGQGGFAVEKRQCRRHRELQ